MNGPPSAQASLEALSSHHDARLQLRLSILALQSSTPLTLPSLQSSVQPAVYVQARYRNVLLVSPLVPVSLSMDNTVSLDTLFTWWVTPRTLHYDRSQRAVVTVQFFLVATETGDQGTHRIKLGQCVTSIRSRGMALQWLTLTHTQQQQLKAQISFEIVDHLAPVPLLKQVIQVDESVETQTMQDETNETAVIETLAKETSLTESLTEQPANHRLHQWNIQCTLLEVQLTNLVPLKLHFRTHFPLLLGTHALFRSPSYSFHSLSNPVHFTFTWTCVSTPSRLQWVLDHVPWWLELWQQEECLGIARMQRNSSRAEVVWWSEQEPRQRVESITVAWGLEGRELTEQEQIIEEPVVKTEMNQEVAAVTEPVATPQEFIEKTKSPSPPPAQITTNNCSTQTGPSLPFSSVQIQNSNALSQQLLELDKQRLQHLQSQDHRLQSTLMALQQQMDALQSHEKYLQEKEKSMKQEELQNQEIVRHFQDKINFLEQELQKEKNLFLTHKENWQQEKVSLQQQLQQQLESKKYYKRQWTLAVQQWQSQNNAVSSVPPPVASSLPSPVMVTPPSVPLKEAVDVWKTLLETGQRDMVERVQRVVEQVMIKDKNLSTSNKQLVEKLEKMEKLNEKQDEKQDEKPNQKMQVREQQQNEKETTEKVDPRREQLLTQRQRLLESGVYQPSDRVITYLDKALRELNV